MSIKRCSVCDITNNPLLSSSHIKATEFDNPKDYAYWIHSVVFLNKKGTTICSYCENIYRNTLKEQTLKDKNWNDPQV